MSCGAGFTAPGNPPGLNTRGTEIRQISPQLQSPHRHRPLSWSGPPQLLRDPHLAPWGPDPLPQPSAPGTLSGQVWQVWQEGWAGVLILYGSVPEGPKGPLPGPPSPAPTGGPSVSVGAGTVTRGNSSWAGGGHLAGRSHHPHLTAAPGAGPGVLVVLTGSQSPWVTCLQLEWPKDLPVLNAGHLQVWRDTQLPGLRPAATQATQLVTGQKGRGSWGQASDPPAAQSYREHV